MIVIAALVMVNLGHALTRKFRKIKQFGAFWCILAVFNPDFNEIYNE